MYQMRRARSGAPPLHGEEPYPGGSAGSHGPERQQILIATRLRPRFLLAHVSGQAMTGTFLA